eukprot:4113966-Pleurochrysis_carterae.AAC.1
MAPRSEGVPARRHSCPVTSCYAGGARVCGVVATSMTPQHCLARGAYAPRGMPRPAASPQPRLHPLAVRVPTRGMVGGGRNTREGGRRRRHAVWRACGACRLPTGAT